MSVAISSSPYHTIDPENHASVAEFVSWGVVVLAAVVLTLVALGAMRRWDAATRAALASSIVAMVPGVAQFVEQLTLLKSYTPFEPKVVGLSALWFFIGPVLFLRSFRRAPRATPRLFRVVRWSHVVAWAVSSAWAMYLMMLV
jgi:hypothetical protein